jgi:hypothetical protein
MSWAKGFGRKEKLIKIRKNFGRLKIADRKNASALIFKYSA